MVNSTIAEIIIMIVGLSNKDFKKSYIFCWELLLNSGNNIFSIDSFFLAEQSSAVNHNTFFISSRMLRLVSFFIFSGVLISLAQEEKPDKPIEEKVATKEEVIAPVSTATLNRLLKDTDTAFAAKDYDAAIRNLTELLAATKDNPNAPLEMFQFNVGLASLLGQKYSEAEKSFLECLKKFPKGSYASRCQLGLGRSLSLQGGKEKQQAAIAPLKLAATDTKLRSEAGFLLAKINIDLGNNAEALKIFKSLMGSDINTPQQTTAAVEVVSLLADAGDLDELIAYMDRLNNQSGVRDAIAWVSLQVTAEADNFMSSQMYDAALALYRSIPPRMQILEVQRNAIEEKRKKLKSLEARAAAENAKPIGERSDVSSLVVDAKSVITVSEEALKSVIDKPEFDALMIMRRGRCLYKLERFEESLICFREIRKKHAKSPDVSQAAFAEILVMNKLEKTKEIQDLAKDYLVNYPKSENVEQIAGLVGESLVQSGKWSEVQKFYADLEIKYPESTNIDRYKFFQAIAMFQNGLFAESRDFFEKFLVQNPTSSFMEDAHYRIAMANFAMNDYKKTLASCNEYLLRFPDGRYAGDILYRLSFIDFNDKQEDKDKLANKIIGSISAYIEKHPDDAAAGSLLCLMGDTYAQKKKESDPVGALESYKKAIWTESPDDVIQYAIDSATAILQSDKNWEGISALHTELLKKRPNSDSSLISASWVAKMKSREGKGREAAEMLADYLKPMFGDPEKEKVEILIDEIVKSIVPRKKVSEVNHEELEKELVNILEKTSQGTESATSAARILYAKARLALMLKRVDRSDFYLEVITQNNEDPTTLSPALLEVSAKILMKKGNLDLAEKMYKRLTDRYKTSAFSDAGPLGLGEIELIRKNPRGALDIFTDTLKNNPGTYRYNETVLGKLKAIAALNQLPEAEELAKKLVTQRDFRGESAGKILMILAEIYRKKADLKPDQAAEDLKVAHAYYQKVYIAYQGFPELCADAYMGAYEVNVALHNDDLALKTLNDLSEHPKLKNTAAAKKAVEMRK
jgi:TolA-binding protein